MTRRVSRSANCSLGSQVGAVGVHAIVGPGLCDIELLDLFLNAGRQDVLGNIEIIVHLKAQPETGRIPKVPCEPQRRIGRDTPPPMDDFVDSTWGDAETTSKFVLTDA